MTEERPVVSLQYNFVDQLENLEKETREAGGDSFYDDGDDWDMELMLGTQPDFEISEKLGVLVPLRKNR
jgi:hypothetical protein